MRGSGWVSVLLVACWAPLLVFSGAPPKNPLYFNIGGVLSNDESKVQFQEIVAHLNFNNEYVPRGTTFHATAIQMESNPIRTALNVCKFLIARRNIHVSFLRTVAPYSHQADVWVELLKRLGYLRVIFIHGSDTDGRALLGRFQTASQSLEDDVDVKVHVSRGLAKCFHFTINLNKCLTEIAFNDKLIIKANIYISMLKYYSKAYVLALAIREMNRTMNITEAPQDCDNSGSIWETGKQLFEFIRRQVLLNGRTGKVAFDDNGDRIFAEYDVVNVQGEQQNQVSVGRYFFSNDQDRMLLQLDESRVIWPGRLRKKPEGFILPTHLKVLTIEEKPFVYTRELKGEHENEDCLPDERVFCCKGFCIDLLIHLSHRINFTYSLALSPDGQFGSHIIKNISGNGKKEWTGLIGELVNDRADMIVAPLTINPERAEFIEFSKPFKYQGITILEKKPSRSSTLVSFLQPFSNTLWILVMVSVHVVALVLYLLDRFSPFGRFKLANSDGTEEDALNLSSAIWFAWGVLLNSGIGEGFAMIIVASYTANLAAFLVLERPKTKLSGINDARLRNTMENLTCATVKGSAVDMYFRRQVELSNMYRTMEANNYDTAEDAIQDVKNRKLMAFIWDSSRLEFEAAQDCELVTAGELFGRSGYGIGLQKGSPWADHVTLAILDFHEST
ncbi:hypothetical protein B566_EDAN014757 [Ephemera danica]|nr:hypothetical protein B566_EDAN014757 [Ephemera danica]